MLDDESGIDPHDVARIDTVTYDVFPVKEGVSLGEAKLLADQETARRAATCGDVFVVLKDDVLVYPESISGTNLKMGRL